MRQIFSISNIKKNKEYIIFFFLILATRTPFVSKILYSWDAVQFSLALEKFNLQQHQPHPPGYILYIGLGKIINFFIDNPNNIYIIISILASFVIAILFYKFCKLLFNDKKFAIIATLVLIFIPYFWYYGEVASSYIFDGLFSILFAYLTLLIIKKQHTKYLFVFSLFLGISGGFRQSLIILFLPLWFFTIFILTKNKKISVKQIFLNIAIFCFLVLVWFIPLILLSSGWKNYWDATNWLYVHASLGTSIFKEADWNFIYANFKNIIKVNLAILNILIISPLFIFSKLNFSKFDNQKSIFALFTFWLVPSFFVYIFIHFGNTGYLMTIALGLILIFLIPLYLFYTKYGFKKTLILSTILIFVSALSFLFLNSKIFNNKYRIAFEHKIKKNNILYDRYTYGEINNFDKKIKTIINEVKKYDFKKTILVCGQGFKYRPSNNEQYFPASFDYFRHLEFYLPEYNLYELFYDENRLMYFHIKNKSPLKINYSNEISIRKNIEKILIITDNIDGDLIIQNSIQEINLGNNQKIFFINAENKTEIPYWQYKFVKADQ